MIHARKDYNHIQDPSGKIPVNEPVFLLRAQDKVAPQVVEIWAMMAELIGAESNIVEAAYDQADEMRAWQQHNVCKTPDAPEDVFCD